MVIKTQSEYAKVMVLGPVNSEQGNTEGGDSQHESPKQSEIAMYLELGVAIAAIFGLVAMATWVLYSAHDWISSIQRFQEMI